MFASPSFESERLAALRSYCLLDTAPEEAFDQITGLAARTFDVPIALISLVDEGRLWFKSAYGLMVREVPRPDAFCAHVILGDEPLIVEDTLLDPYLRSSPMVQGDPGIRFYAGAPLKTPDGFRLGSLCLIDRVPRAFEVAKRQLLEEMAVLVVEELEQRRSVLKSIQARKQIDRRFAELRTRVEPPTVLPEAHSAPDTLDALVGTIERLLSEELQGSCLSLALEIRTRAWNLRERVQLIDSILSNVSDAILATEAHSVDEAGPRIVYANLAFEHMTGYSLQEVNGKNPHFLQAPTTDRAELDRIRIALENRQPVRAELLNLHKSGSEFWSEISVVPVADEFGRYTHWVSLQRDITERKKAEGALREREAFFHGVVNTAGEGIWIVGASGDTRFANKRVSDLLGSSEEEVPVLAAVLDPLERPAVLARLAALAFETIRFTTLLRRADGSEQWVIFSARRLEMAVGSSGDILLMLTDATETKQLHAERLSSELAQIEAQELHKLSELKDDFLSNISHELRTPIANIRLAVQLLRHSPVAAQQKKYLDILESECLREKVLIDNLLDLQSLEVNDRPLELSPLNLSVWLPEQLAPFMARTASRQQSLQLQLAAELPWLVTEAHSLESVLSELLNNACKYTPDGGSIALAVSSDEHWLSLDVCNSGAQIPQELLQKVFEKFYRHKANDHWHQGGTGLGLALVKRILNRLGGSIEATSPPNQVVFHLQLPLSTV